MKTKLLTTSALVLGALGVPAFAQDASDTEATESRTLQTVRITATKREQTLQDVPIAVSVVDADVIAESQITDIIDLQSIVPSLRVSQAQQSGNTTFSIRGFGNGTNNVGTEPAVAVFIDGVYRARSAGGLSDYPDLERIEVLRGPQSTLFGKNASVGVISVVTAQPQFDFGASLEGTLGNYDARILKGTITGPLSDTVAVSLSGSINQRDGYAENVELGTELNDRDRYGLKGQLLFQPNDNLSVRLIADYDTLDEVCCYSPNITSGPTEAAIVGVGGQVITDPFGYQTALDVDPVNEITNSGLSATVDWDIGPGTLTSISAYRTQELMSDGDVDFTSLNAIEQNLLDYEIDYFTQEVRYAGSTDNFDYLFGAYYFDETVDLTSNVLYDSGFYLYGAGLAGALSGSPTIVPEVEAALGFAPFSFFAPGTGSTEFFEQDNTSYSLFAQGDFHLTDRLTATLGVSYINDEKTVSGRVDNTDLFASLDLAQELNDPDVLRAISLENVTAIGASFDDAVLATSYELVTMMPFNTADYIGLLTAAGGGDPTAVATVGAINATTMNPAVQGAVATPVAAGLADALGALQFLPPFLDFPNAVESDSTEDSDVTYTARLAYDLTDNLNVYGSYATGFKASSWNLTRDSSFLESDRAALDAAGLIPNNRTNGTRFADPEETTVFEVGAKFATPTFNLNVALFDQTVENFQSTLFQGTGFFLLNAGEQSTTGFEWDATWLPTDQLSLFFSGILQDPTYDSFPGAATPWVFNEALGFYVQDDVNTVDFTGQQPAGISETSFSLGGKFEQDLTNSITGFVRADYAYDSEVQAVDNVVGVDREVNNVNASAGLVMDNGLEVTLWGRNIFDDEYFQTAFPTVAQDGSVNGYANAPATYGVTVRKTW
ncbi:MAG: TonB-dependent receptor [Pseudomonadota bacterium]